MSIQTLQFIEPMTEDQRNELNSLRQQALESTPFPSTPLFPPTPEELQMHLETLAEPRSPEHQIKPRARRTQRPPKVKINKSHAQLKGTDRKRLELLISQLGDKLDSQTVANTFEIEESYAKYLLKKYQKTKTLAIKTGKRGSKPLSTPETLQRMRAFMEKNPLASDKEISEHLSSSKVTPWQVHSTTIGLWRNEVMPKMGLEKWTLKNVSKRSPNANTPENKAYRKKVMSELKHWKDHERVIVYIDETHFEFRKNWGRGKAPSGEKALYEGKLLAVGMSAISAITVNGPLLCHIHVKGTITAERFMDFFKELLIKCGDQECCFFLDNATVHRKEDIVAAAEERNQAVLFNAPYSCEMNPIENFFGTWKTFTMRKARDIENVMELKEAVGSAFLEISAGTCQKIIKHITHVILPKVLNDVSI